MDKVTVDKRSENMRRIRSKDTRPEIAVRKLVYGLGYRYRLHKKDLPGKPDLVFFNRKKLIFVHGCFWHQHNSNKCRISRKPKSNLGYWSLKLKRNQQRDQRNQQQLKSLGWQTLIVWECELKDYKSVQKRITNFLK